MAFRHCGWSAEYLPYRHGQLGRVHIAMGYGVAAWQPAGKFAERLRSTRGFGRHAQRALGPRRPCSNKRSKTSTLSRSALQGTHLEDLHKELVLLTCNLQLAELLPRPSNILLAIVQHC